MTKFQDGPAGGQTLMLKRAPVFLRVARDKSTSAIDALDQLDDVPSPNEALFVYILAGPPGYAFVDGPKCRGRYAIAEYKIWMHQPADEVMRDNDRWALWVDDQAKRINVEDLWRKD